MQEAVCEKQAAFCIMEIRLVNITAVPLLYFKE